MVPFFNGFNYYEKLFIMDFIIYFCRCEFPGVKRNKVEFFIEAFLGKDYP